MAGFGVSINGRFWVSTEEHASAALDEIRRQEFFRAGPAMREHGRGKRWLLLRRWKTVRGSKRADPVRFGVVESINTTIKAVLRRARGMKDEEMLLLKLKWATAHPIRSARDLARFLTVQPLYLNR